MSFIHNKSFLSISSTQEKNKQNDCFSVPITLKCLKMSKENVIFDGFKSSLIMKPSIKTCKNHLKKINSQEKKFPLLKNSSVIIHLSLMTESNLTWII